MASFPEICNTLHMCTKCVPDARGSCVVHAVLSAPRHTMSSKIVLSHIRFPTWETFLEHIVYVYAYLFIFQLTCREACSYSDLNLLTHLLYCSDIVQENKSLSQKDPLKCSVDS